MCVSLHIVTACTASDLPGLDEEYKAIAQLHTDLTYYDDVLHGIVGPFSTICMSPVFDLRQSMNNRIGLFHTGKLLAFYNIPVMPHAAVGSAVAETSLRELFPTLARVAHTSTSMAMGKLLYYHDVLCIQVCTSSSTTTDGCK